MLITVHVTGLDNAQARLTKLGDSLHDFALAFETLAKELLLFFGDTVFVSSGGALGEPWAPLKTATEIEKNKKWPGRGILERSGTLKQSFFHEATPKSLFISNRAPYFPYHQLGTSAGAGRGHNIPMRRMLGVNATVESMIRLAIETDVRAKIDATNI